jgi:hypothetical protein
METSLKKHPDTIVEAYADKMYAKQIKNANDRLAQRLKDFPSLAADSQQRHDEMMKQLTPEHVEQWKDRQRSDCRDMISEIQEQPCCYRMLNAGRFHPDNKLSREVFEGVTGIKLPPTVGGTIETIKKHIGLAWIERKESEIAAGIVADMLKKQTADNEAKSNRKTYLLSIVKQSIAGPDLVELARMMGIEVLPQTAGVLLKKIGRIKSGCMEIYGKPSTAGAWKLYNQVIATIDDVEPELSPEDDKKVDEVFA